MAFEYKRTVLIVDSEQNWQKRLVELLSLEFLIIIANNYAEALDRLSDQSSTFHVVVTEISLDENDIENKDGFLLADRVNGLGGNIQTIILTRYGDIANTRIALREKKLFNLLEKTPGNGQPLNESDLLENIREAAEIAGRNVFLIMPFAETFDGFFKQISRIVEGMGLVCRRADDVFRPNVVMASILDEINYSRIAIADLSGGNPNVYFETGIAHARGKNVILLTRNEDDISRNLRVLRYLTYKDSLDGASKLGIDLPKAIEHVRTNNSPPLEKIDIPELDFCLVVTRDDDESQDTFQQVIKPVLAEFSLPYTQLKDIFYSRDILKERRVKLHSSQFIITDVYKADADIFYLAGYAYGLGKDVIYLARREKDIPFDMRVASSIIYSKDRQSAILKAKNELSDAVKAILTTQTKGWIMKSETPIKVFINHATEDKPLVRKLHSDLKKFPWIDLWIDEERLLPGQELELEIDKAMKEADAVLVCMSKTSINKTGYVQAEIRKAEEQQKLRPPGSIYMIPVLLELCQIPNSLQKYLWVNISEPGKVELIIKSLESLRK